MYIYQSYILIEETFKLERQSRVWGGLGGGRGGVELGGGLVTETLT